MPQKQRPKKPREEEALQELARKTERDVSKLNHCLDDIELFIAKLERLAITYSGMVRKYDGKSPRDGLQNIPHPPNEGEYVDIFQKMKFAFNLIAKLKGHIHEPNAAELVHYIFVPLGPIVQTCGGPRLARSVISPLLTPQAIQLLGDCLMSKESDLWSSLGSAWATPKSAWPSDQAIPEYEPRFHSRGKPSKMSARLSNQTDVGKRISAADATTKEEIQTAGNVIPMEMKCIQDFVAEYRPELTIVTGEHLEVLDGRRIWWLVRNNVGQTGFVPSTFLEPVVKTGRSKGDKMTPEVVQPRADTFERKQVSSQERPEYQFTSTNQRVDTPQETRHSVNTASELGGVPSHQRSRYIENTSTHPVESSTRQQEQSENGSTGEPHRQSSPYENDDSQSPADHVIRQQERKEEQVPTEQNQTPPGTPKAIAKYDFVARNHKELTIMARDVLEIIDDSRMWWYVRNSSDELGYVPSPLLQRLPHSTSAEQAAHSDLPETTEHNNRHGQELTIVQDVFSTEDDSYFEPSYHQDMQGPTQPSPPPPPPPPLQSVEYPYAQVQKTSTKRPYYIIAKETGNDFGEVEHQEQAGENWPSNQRLSNAPIPEMQPDDVIKWLQSKGFSKATVYSLGVLSGSQLLTLTEEELIYVCGEEGLDVYNELAHDKSGF